MEEIEAEAKQREEGMEGWRERESARPVGVRWRETVAEERERRRWASEEDQREVAGQWRVALEMRQGLFGETKWRRNWSGVGGEWRRSTPVVAVPRLRSLTSSQSFSISSFMVSATIITVLLALLLH